MSKRSAWNTAAGTPLRGWGLQAVNASKALLASGVDAILNGLNRFNWENFKGAWLMSGDLAYVDHLEKIAAEQRNIDAKREIDRINRSHLKW